MWRYGYGWWIALFFILFILLLRRRGRALRYRRRPIRMRRKESPAQTARLEPPVDTGSGWLGIALLIVLLVAISWAIGAWGWRWHSR